MTINYYSYEELKAAVIANASEENVNALDEWLEN